MKIRNEQLDSPDEAIAEGCDGVEERYPQSSPPSLENELAAELAAIFRKNHAHVTRTVADSREVAKLLSKKGLSPQPYSCIFGNDCFTADPRSKQQVNLIRQGLIEIGVREFGFATSHDGVTWAMVIEDNRNSCEIESLLWRAWDAACGSSPYRKHTGVLTNRPVIQGYGHSDTTAFVITVTGDQDVEDVCSGLTCGDLYFQYGDDALYDEDGRIIGTVEWTEWAEFIVHEAELLRR